eukprot:TRINITY_DN2654_c0_g1_i2.p1 TRINITY_DN2654_c0_g1~~TRINITY_DN2654_c0_g1_i2.p1  ORF type:complete len:297 (+),score=47.24 TRINITY_DN2654_c0_g1_i2:318-1208(+)
MYLLLHNKFYSTPHVCNTKVSFGESRLKVLLAKKITKVEIVCKMRRAKGDMEAAKKDLLMERSSEHVEKLRLIACKLAKKIKHLGNSFTEEVEDMKTQEELVKRLESIIGELNGAIRVEVQKESRTAEDYRKLVENYFTVKKGECLTCSCNKYLIHKLNKGTAPPFNLCRNCFVDMVPPILATKDKSLHPKAERWLEEFAKQNYTLEDTEYVYNGLTDDVCDVSVIADYKKDGFDFMYSREKCKDCGVSNKVIEMFNTCAITRHVPLCLKCCKTKLINSNICPVCYCIVEDSLLKL